ncbi:hypothetical protein G5C66_18580 [Nocardioides sp. KC13]|uniref:Uncharacterized protein n=1 Tax=Nocardioides turkmenicus TaxID=2711220 RepID=A0A6M1RAS6_9ACTN|nr:hypothetical protein [Nocardioides sp. KC13]NGN94738.1 hypothetical protein [Nocardioides sp. KC13]
MNTLADLGRPDSRFQTLLSGRSAAVVGVLGAMVTVAIAGQPRFGLALGCLSVVGLYGVYPTFSIGWGTPRERLTEWAFTLVGIGSIVLALSLDPRWLALAWSAHGVWDALHHRRHHVVGLRGIPPWYIQTCLVWDFLAAAGLLILL